MHCHRHDWNCHHNHNNNIDIDIHYSHCNLFGDQHHDDDPHQMLSCMSWSYNQHTYHRMIHMLNNIDLLLMLDHHQHQPLSSNKEWVHIQHFDHSYNMCSYNIHDWHGVDI